MTASERIRSALAKRVEANKRRMVAVKAEAAKAQAGNSLTGHYQNPNKELR